MVRPGGPCGVMWRVHRLLKQIVWRMFGLVNSRLSLDWIRHWLSGSWNIILKVGLGIVVLAPAIRYWIGNRNRIKPRDGDGETVTSSCPSEGQGETATVPGREPEQDKRSAYAEDEYYCKYDSTWDSEDSQEEESEEEDTGSRPSAGFRAQSAYKYRRFQAAAMDLQIYRHDYPIKHERLPIQENEAKQRYPNLYFYLEKQPSLPDSIYINDFHRSWKGNYDKLESVHSYIQWLFPLQEPGVNPEASILTKEEIEKFCQNDIAKSNLLKSYKLMLDFYGIELRNETTGEVKKAANWEERAFNLNNRTHNNLRITRILKCLGTLGFKHYQAPLVRFFLEETLVQKRLPNVKDSVLNYFLFAVLDKKQRRSLVKFAYLNYDKEEEFVWCPKRLQRKWSASKHET